MKSRLALNNEHAYFGRLNHAKAVRMYHTYEEFLEVNIGGSLKVVTAVATQGHGSRNEWVKQYTLSYSADGADWFNYTQHGQVKVCASTTLHYYMT